MRARQSVVGIRVRPRRQIWSEARHEPESMRAISDDESEAGAPNPCHAGSSGSAPMFRNGCVAVSLPHPRGDRNAAHGNSASGFQLSVGCYNPPMNCELREKGYTLVKGLLEPSMARVVYRMFLLKQWREQCFRDNHIPTAVSMSNDVITDALLLDLLPRIEEISGCRLVPTYSYARLYFHGDAMLRHRDRGSCEVSVSIHLGKDGGDSSLWFAPDSKVEMDGGDGAIYLGCEAEHWRDPFSGSTLGQMFLHYVVAGGRFAESYFEGNPGRFPTSISDLSRTGRAESPNLAQSPSLEGG
jgi:hypothetical protein